MLRRAFLAGLGATFAVPVRAGEAPPASAAALAQTLDGARSALGLTMKNAAGERVDIASFAGRLVVLNLWAPWCVPCRREMPSLSRLAARLGDAAALLPLSFDWRGAKAIEAFYAEHGIANLPVLSGDGENLKETLGLTRLPTTALIDRRGDCFATVAGEAQWDDEATLEWLRRLAAA